MATAEQYAEWIVKNQAKKGTPEFETVAAAYKEARNERASTPTEQPAEMRNIRGELVGPEAPWSKAKDNFKTLADFASGASNTMRGALNLVSSGTGDKVFPKSTNEGAAKFVGELADPVAWTIGGGIGKVLPYAPVLGKGFVGGTGAVAKNAATGAVTGGTLGTLADDGTAVGGAGMGAAANVVAPMVLGGAGKVGGTVGRIIDAMIIPGGATRAAGRAANDVAASGLKTDAAKQKVDDVIVALQNAKPGETAGQAAVPTGNAEFQGLARIARKNAPSEFEAVRISQEADRGVKWDTLNAQTGPLRERALTGAKTGEWFGTPLKSSDVIANIDKQLSDSAISKLATKTLNTIKDDILNKTGGNGVINADALYTIRKEIGNTISVHAKETGNWDKKVSSGIEREVQKGIDDAIEGAGGGGWKEYLRQFSSGAKAIGAEEERDLVAKALEKAGSSKARNIYGIDEAPFSLPNALYRPVMIANALLKRAEGMGAKKTTDELSRLMLPQNVQELAKVMKNAKSHEKAALVEEIARRAAVIGASQQGER